MTTKRKKWHGRTTASEDPTNLFSRAWYRAKTEKKNRNELKWYTARLAALKEIKQPNDWQKNQIAHAQDQIKKYSDKNLKKPPLTSAAIRGEQKKDSSKTIVTNNNKEVKNNKPVVKNNKPVVKNNKPVVNPNNKVVKNNNNKVVKNGKLEEEKRKYRRTKGEGIEKKSEGYRGDTRITRHLKKSGWSETRLAEKRKAHAEWKAKRKNRNTLKKTKGV